MVFRNSYVVLIFAEALESLTSHTASGSLFKAFAKRKDKGGSSHLLVYVMSFVSRVVGCVLPFKSLQCFLIVSFASIVEWKALAGLLSSYFN